MRARRSLGITSSTARSSERHDAPRHRDLGFSLHVQRDVPRAGAARAVVGGRRLRVSGDAESRSNKFDRYKYARAHAARQRARHRGGRARARRTSCTRRARVPSRRARRFVVESAFQECRGLRQSARGGTRHAPAAINTSTPAGRRRPGTVALCGRDAQRHPVELHRASLGYLREQPARRQGRGTPSSCGRSRSAPARPCSNVWIARTRTK